MLLQGGELGGVRIPKERLVGIWMMQAPGQRNHYRELFRNMVYAALE